MTPGGRTPAGEPAAGGIPVAGAMHRREPEPRRRRAGAGRRRRLSRVLTGEAGQGTAWVLAAAALLVAFLATAAPREVTATGATALDRTVASLSGGDTGIMVTGQWVTVAGSPSRLITPSDVTDVSGDVAQLMHPPLTSPPAERWGGFATNALAVSNPARSALISLPPTMEIAYRSALARHGRLVSGTWARRATVSYPAAAGATGGRHRGAAVTTLQVAVTPAIASRFSVRVGSVVELGPSLHLRVSGIVAPTDPAGPFWATDPLPAAPEQEGSERTAHWVAGVLVGPAELTAVQDAVSGQPLQGTWFLPIQIHGITPATLPRLLGQVDSVTTGNLPTSIGPPAAGGGAPFTFQAQPVANSNLAMALSSFQAQQQSAATISALIVVGLLAASLMLLLICARLAADAYSPELTLLRVRGGSTRQAGLRILGRTSLVAGPTAVAGALLAVLAVPGGDGTRLPWLPGLAVVVTAVGAPAVIAAWQHRHARRPAGGGREETAAVRRSPRRTVAEATVIILAAGALATLRLQGSQAQSDTYTSASPLLAALAASLLAARIYPVPVRSLLRVAAARPGAVGFVGLARAARTRRGAVAPALALVLTMTMAAFVAMVAGSVTAGQRTTSWQRVGADAELQAAGNNVISARAQRALGGVPGVTGEAAVYTATASGALAAQLHVGPGPVRNVGLTMVTPGPYATLARQTPWPDFPAGLLARGAAGGDRVPVLASQSLAAALGTGPGRAAQAGGPATGTLELDGETIKVSVEATIGSTPANPAAGLFVVLPSWAAARLPSIPGPDILLATGAGVGSGPFRRAAAALVPGGQLTLRQQEIREMRAAPALVAAQRIVTLGIWAAAALAVIAILLGLAISAASRARLAGRMAALGMAARQSWGLAVTETVPLLAVGILGMLAAAVGLALLIGPALNLAVFAGGAGSVPVRPQTGALVLTAAGAVIVALAIVGTQSALALRRDSASAVAQEEAG
jgi:putative ABC transport system permease protein